ncbi:hypothetical protein [Trebonia sp.]|uniref:hypothetical protein n=1 Tax=Trebonia sp. TaxID=2767075 RepID=UPI003BAFDA1F
MPLRQQGLALADEVPQLAVTADLTGARVVDDHLTWPHGLQGPNVTVVQRGDVLPHGVGLARGARLLPGQLHGTGEVRKPRHPPPP